MEFFIENWISELEKELKEERELIGSHWISHNKIKISYSKLSLQEIKENIELIKKYRFRLNYLPFLENELRKRENSSKKEISNRVNLTNKYIRKYRAKKKV